MLKIIVNVRQFWIAVGMNRLLKFLSLLFLCIQFRQLLYDVFLGGSYPLSLSTLPVFLEFSFLNDLLFTFVQINLWLIRFCLRRMTWDSTWSCMFCSWIIKVSKLGFWAILSCFVKGLLKEALLGIRALKIGMGGGWGSGRKGADWIENEECNTLRSNFLIPMFDCLICLSFLALSLSSMMYIRVKKWYFV